MKSIYNSKSIKNYDENLIDNKKPQHAFVVPTKHVSILVRGFYQKP